MRMPPQAKVVALRAKLTKRVPCDSKESWALMKLRNER
jgi:hypothetical protein